MGVLILRCLRHLWCALRPAIWVIIPKKGNFYPLLTALDGHMYTLSTELFGSNCC